MIHGDIVRKIPKYSNGIRRKSCTKAIKTKSFKRLSSDGNLNHFPKQILYDLLQQIFLFQNMISAEIVWMASLVCRSLIVYMYI